MTKWNPELGVSDDPIYLKIARALVADVTSGRLRQGDRLPPQRTLARSLGVSIGTITRAYEEAERRGVVRGETGRGTFVGDTAQDVLSSLVAANRGEDLVDLSVAYPVDSEAPDIAAALRAVAARSDVSQLMRYEAQTVGMRHLEAGAEWLNRFGMATEMDVVVPTVGAHHAFSVILAAITEPGDLVLTDELAFSGFVETARQRRLRLQGIAMDEDGMIPDSLRVVCRQRKARVLFLTPTIHNPTTTVLSEGRRSEIAEIADEHDLLIIEDEAIRLLMPDAPPPVSSLVPDRSFFIATTSKAIGGGLRVAFVASPRFALDTLRHAVWNSVWMVPPLNLELVARWIEDGTAEKVAGRKRREAIARQGIVAKMLAPSEYRTQPASYFVWLKLPSSWSSSEFANEVRRRGVAVTPAGAFTLDPTKTPNAVRICVSAVEDRAQLRKGLGIIADTLAGRGYRQAPLV